MAKTNGGFDRAKVRLTESAILTFFGCFFLVWAIGLSWDQGPFNEGYEIFFILFPVIGIFCAILLVGAGHILAMRCDSLFPVLFAAIGYAGAACASFVVAAEFRPPETSAWESATRPAALFWVLLFLAMSAWTASVDANKIRRRGRMV